MVPIPSLTEFIWERWIVLGNFGGVITFPAELATAAAVCRTSPNSNSRHRGGNTPHCHGQTGTPCPERETLPPFDPHTLGRSPLATNQLPAVISHQSTPPMSLIKLSPSQQTTYREVWYYAIEHKFTAALIDWLQEQFPHA